MPSDKKKRQTSPQGSLSNSMSPRKVASTLYSTLDSLSVQSHSGGEPAIKSSHGVVSQQNPITGDDVSYPWSSRQACHLSIGSHSSQQTENSQEDDPDTFGHLLEIQNRDLFTRGTYAHDRVIMKSSANK